MRDAALLTVAEMGRADRLTIERGTPGIVLMENAGRAIADAIIARFRPQPVAVLCGPGNNGGDGFVVARLLRTAGWPVRVGLLGPRERLRGDAALAAAAWTGPVEPCGPALLDGRPLVVDALFGAGLARPLDGEAAAVVRAVADARLTAVAVDMPSGVSGDDGAVWGVAAPAALTVTFFRKKPGHLLYPGRGLCGDLVVCDIGIPDAVLTEIDPQATENCPALWQAALAPPAVDGHKYRRGHALVWGSGGMTGAARLAALAARRAGAGLVTVAAPDQAVPIYAGDSPGTIVAPRADWQMLLDDRRFTTVVIGPGAGRTQELAEAVLATLRSGKPAVLDADALTVFADDPARLISALHGQVVLTPHTGEFGRVFPTLSGCRLQQARAAAAMTGAVVVLKGADSVIAHPDGRAAINANAPASLATAGSGDVLAGMVAARLAQGAQAFSAAAAAVWLHGSAAALGGSGLIAEDIIGALPQALTALPAWAKQVG